MTQFKPLVAVVGTTGVGKSKLAIQIAQAIGGQIINADSMQVYKGLDLATNKPTMEERNRVPHHLFDFVDPFREYSVSEFASDALKSIEKIHSQNQVPVIVGGTNYYIQSLLWDHNIIATSPNATLSDHHSIGELAHPSLCDAVRAELQEALEATNPKSLDATQIADYVHSGKLITLLEKIDPPMAARWHPNDSRRIRRSLEVFYTTGRRQSDLMEEQNHQKHASSQLRYPTLVFWLYGAREALNPRLDARVDDMINVNQRLCC